MRAGLPQAETSSTLARRNVAEFIPQRALAPPAATFLVAGRLSREVLSRRASCCRPGTCGRPAPFRAKTADALASRMSARFCLPVRSPFSQGPSRRWSTFRAGRQRPRGKHRASIRRPGRGKVNVPEGDFQSGRDVHARLGAFIRIWHLNQDFHGPRLRPQARINERFLSAERLSRTGVAQHFYVLPAANPRQLVFVNVCDHPERGKVRDFIEVLSRFHVLSPVGVHLNDRSPYWREKHKLLENEGRIHASILQTFLDITCWTARFTFSGPRGIMLKVRF